MKNKIELTREKFMLCLHDAISLYQKGIAEMGGDSERARNRAVNEVLKQGGKQVKESKEMTFVTNPADVDIDEGNRDLFGE